MRPSGAVAPCARCKRWQRQAGTQAGGRAGGQAAHLGAGVAALDGGHHTQHGLGGGALGDVHLQW